MTAQVTFRAKAAVLEVLFGAHSELVRVPEEVELEAQEVLFEMELVGSAEAAALWEALGRMWVVVVVQAVQALAAQAAQYGQVVRERNQGAGAEARMAWMAWTVLCWRMAWTVLWWRMRWAVVWPSCRWQLLCRQQQLQSCRSILTCCSVAGLSQRGHATGKESCELRRRVVPTRHGGRWRARCGIGAGTSSTGSSTHVASHLRCGPVVDLGLLETLALCESVSAALWTGEEYLRWICCRRAAFIVDRETSEMWM